MGVSGVGKTTIARALAAESGGTYIEADDLHPPENVAAMRAGHPLTDEMRAPWLKAVAAAMADVPKGSVFATCSALKRSYREQLRGDLQDVFFLYLKGEREVIAARMGARLEHFMPLSLLDTQFATLEAPDTQEAHAVVTVDGTIEDTLALARVAMRAS